MSSRNIPATPTTYRSQSMRPSAYRTNPNLLPDMVAGPAVRFEDLRQGRSATRERVQRAANGAHDAAEGDSPGQEGVDGLLVGGIQDGRVASTLRRRVAGQPDAREAAFVELVKLEAVELGGRRRRHGVRHAVGVGEGDRDGQPH